MNRQARRSCRLQGDRSRVEKDYIEVAGGEMNIMISPETYYEFELKGKGQKEILSRIRSLKREISRLKRELENPEDDTEIMILPSPLTRIKLNREYLEMAKRASAEAGGIYKPTKAEQKDQAFNDSLRNMTKLVFE